MIHRHVKRIKSRHVKQLIIYGLVGGSAFIVQTLVYFIGLYLHIFPSVAMILGNFTGMLVAYYGHIKFTFQKNSFSKREFFKFVITSAIGLTFNVLSIRLLTKMFMVSPQLAVIPTIITPGLTFIISKFWVFR